MSTLPLVSTAFVVASAGLAAQAPDFAPERLMADVEVYYGFGVHRTAHEADAEQPVPVLRRQHGRGRVLPPQVPRVPHLVVAPAQRHPGLDHRAARPVPGALGDVKEDALEIVGDHLADPIPG